MKRKLARQLSIDEDPFHFPVPCPYDMMPMLGLDQAGFGFVKGCSIEIVAVVGDKSDAAFVNEQPNPTALGKFMLRDQALPAAEREGAYPTLQRQLRQKNLLRPYFPMCHSHRHIQRFG